MISEKQILTAGMLTADDQQSNVRNRHELPSAGHG